MIADGEKYLGLLDKIDRYAYYIDEAQTRTDFTDEEMIDFFRKRCGEVGFMEERIG